MSTNKAMALMGMVRQLSHTDVANLPQKSLCDLQYLSSCLEQICSHEMKRRSDLHEVRLGREQAQQREEQEVAEEIMILHTKFGV